MSTLRTLGLGPGLLISLSLSCGAEPSESSEVAVAAHRARCDLGALEALAQLPEHPRRARAVSVAVGVVDACGDGLFPTGARVLSATAEAVTSGEALRLIDLPDTPEPAWAEALERSCPGLRQALVEVADAPEAERFTALYDSCGFERYGVLEAQELSAQPYTGPLLWSVHQHLLDQGLGARSARSITRSLFDLWLLASSPYLVPADLVLPRGAVSSGRALRPEDLLVVITPTQLRLDLPSDSPGQPRASTVVATLEHGALAPGWKVQGEAIFPLHDALLAAGVGQNPSSAGEAAGPSAVLVADQSTPFPTVFRVLQTLSKTDLRWFGIMIDVGSFEQRVLDLGPSLYSLSGIYPAFAISIKAEGFSFTHRIDLPMRDGVGLLEEEPPGRNPGPEPDLYDYATLASIAMERRAIPGDLSRVRLLGGRDVPLRVVTRTIEAVRGPGCDALAETNCVYSRVSLEGWRR